MGTHNGADSDEKGILSSLRGPNGDMSMGPWWDVGLCQCGIVILDQDLGLSGKMRNNQKISIIFMEHMMVFSR